MAAAPILTEVLLDESKHKRIVLIAGGSRITPMMEMLRYIDDLCVPVYATLIYRARSERDMFFLRDLSALRARLPNFHFVPVLSQGPADAPGWKGRLRHEIFEVEVERLPESTFFLCGPTPFMQHARALLRDLAMATGAKIRDPPNNFEWALEMRVEDLDGNVLRIGSDSEKEAPLRIMARRRRHRLETSGQRVLPARGVKADAWCTLS